ncbi:MAG: DUF4296 domain-containing protein [Bacteroidetes bacterium]|nr:DUF4296 domain-containing protein [Bacteroidota bacterium]
MKWFSLISTLIVLASCGSGNEVVREKPNGVLPIDSMAMYMADVHLLDAATRHREVRKLGIQAHVKKAYFDYFDTCGISRVRFDKSLDYWSADNEEMIQVYDLSMEILSTKLADIKGASAVEEEEPSLDEQLEDGARVRKKKTL